MYFSSFLRRSNISIRKTLERIRKSYSFSQNDLKYEITLTKNLLRKASKLPISLEQFLSFIATWKAALVVTGSCNSSHHQPFMREKFFKNEITENISQKFHDQWKIGYVDLLSVERIRAEKIDLDDFVDEFDSQHDNRRIKLHWVDNVIKF